MPIARQDKDKFLRCAATRQHGDVMRGTNEWTEVLVKERARNFVTTFADVLTYDRA